MNFKILSRRLLSSANLMPVGFLGLLLLVFRTFDVNTALPFSIFWRSYSLKIQNSNGFNTFLHRICVTFTSGWSDHLDRSELIAILGEWGNEV
ncbi:hypothetical protein B0H14DRAFT_2847895 [Mycena olivaceomarginata]|nr:hypothetical protein B0H14DRAFT_2847895 [Mycena olivaceomarginata]